MDLCASVSLMIREEENSIGFMLPLKKGLCLFICHRPAPTRWTNFFSTCGADSSFHKFRIVLVEAEICELASATRKSAAAHNSKLYALAPRLSKYGAGRIKPSRIRLICSLEPSNAKHRHHAYPLRNFQHGFYLVFHKTFHGCGVIAKRLGSPHHGSQGDHGLAIDPQVKCWFNTGSLSGRAT